MMTKLDQTLEGKRLPKHLQLYRDEYTGAMEIRFWRFQPTLLFLIPFASVWSGITVGGIYILPLLKGEPIKNVFVGIPFLLGSLFLWGIVFLMLFGRGRVYLESGRGRYTFKVFGLGVSRSFDLRKDTEVSCEEVVSSKGVAQTTIRVRNDYQSVKICTGWSEDAVDFVYDMLQQKMV